MEFYKNLDLKDVVYFCDIQNCMRTELWKDVPDYDGMYQSSDLGRFKSFMYHNGTSERILSQHKTKKGYLSINLYKNRKSGSFLAHRITAITFIPNPLNLPEVNHLENKDGVVNKSDNRPFLLEWSTHDDNISHAVKNSLMQKGEVSHQSILTEKEVLEIRANSHLRKVDLAKLYKVAPQTISAIIHGKSWKHLL